MSFETFGGLYINIILTVIGILLYLYLGTGYYS